MNGQIRNPFFYFRVAAWLSSQPVLPTCKEIQAQFGVSKPTAERYHRYWKSVYRSFSAELDSKLLSDLNAETARRVELERIVERFQWGRA